MKNITQKLMRRVVAGFVITAGGLAAADGINVEQVVSRLANSTLDIPLLRELEDYPPEPQVLAAVEEQFKKRNVKENKQRLALTLIHLGASSDEYYNCVAKFAQEAIESPVPVAEKYLPSGEWVKGEFNPAFLLWCEQNGKYPTEMARRQGEGISDVWYLARTFDRRAVPLLRRALESPNPPMVGIAAEGLGILQDFGAVPLIARRCEQLPPNGRFGVAAALAFFDTPEAYNLMSRFMDRGYINEFKRVAMKKRVDALSEIRHRRPISDRQ